MILLDGSDNQHDLQSKEESISHSGKPCMLSIRHCSLRWSDAMVFIRIDLSMNRNAREEGKIRHTFSDMI